MSTARAPSASGLEDVRAAANAAVHEDGHAAGDARRNRRQRVNRRHHAVELPAAMIRDHDAGGAVFERQRGVFRGQDAFDQHAAGS